MADYKVWVAFDDGTSGEVSLDGALSGPVFEPLKDIAIFQNIAVDPELETVVRPSGTDLAPKFLKAPHCK